MDEARFIARSVDGKLEVLHNFASLLLTEVMARQVIFNNLDNR